MQDRFQALLKRRLQVEIESRPPLFPWETEIQEYPTEALGLSGGTVWLKQLQNLDLPVALPEEVLSALLKKCQAIAQSSLKQGVKLIQAVEPLFPEQPQTLDRIAGMVLANAGAVRSTAAAPPLAELAGGYEAANPQQQIALAMLAAQELLKTLSLTVSPQNSQRSRQWLTDQGTVQLTATYQSEPAKELVVQVDLPCGGEIHLAETGTEGTELSAQRSQVGQMALSLSDPKLGQRYQVCITVTDAAEPLIFSLQVVDEAVG
ncbi:MAG: PatU [Leptolyngbyaceae cyanobacterium SL_1_1]|nr:PatU [Leptolyngbyaceae cyanobacterium RM1_1_2]NJO11930.1 PatU [Leptolyngbyaceae cyanobacterium SL_1_1]